MELCPHCIGKGYETWKFFGGQEEKRTCEFCFGEKKVATADKYYQLWLIDELPMAHWPPNKEAYERMTGEKWDKGE